MKRFLRRSTLVLAVGAIAGGAVGVSALAHQKATTKKAHPAALAQTTVDSTTGGLQLDNVEIRNATADSATIFFDVVWPDGHFPGIYRCTWTAKSADGSTVGTVSDGLAILAPDTGLKEDVSTSGVAASATASCDQRLDDGQPYAYDFSDVSITPAATGTATISYTAKWAGTGHGGAVSCTATALDGSGAPLGTEVFNLMVYVGTLDSSVTVKSDALRNSEPTAAQIDCVPLSDAS